MGQKGRRDLRAGINYLLCARHWAWHDLFYLSQTCEDNIVPILWMKTLRCFKMTCFRPQSLTPLTLKLYSFHPTECRKTDGPTWEHRWPERQMDRQQGCQLLHPKEPVPPGICACFHCWAFSLAVPSAWGVFSGHVLSSQPCQDPA